MEPNSYSQILRSDYDTAPKHESMHRSSDYDSWDCYHYDRESYHYISRMLDNSVGKDFDVVFSNICNRFRKKKNYEVRREFLRRIDPYYKSPRYRWRYNEYYLDENKVIRSYNNRSKKRKKVKVKTIDRPSEYFVAKTKVFNEYPGTKEIVCKYLGNELSYKLFEEHLPIKYYPLVISYINKALDLLYPFVYPRKGVFFHRISASDFLCILDRSDYVTYYEGDKKFYKYLAEAKDAANKVRRESKRNLEEYRSSLLNTIESRRRDKENLENIVTRDRLGFAEDSFTGEFYHGRKKRKQSQNTEEVKKIS